MKVGNIAFKNSNPSRSKFLNSKNTGYIAAAGIALTMVSGFGNNQTIRKNHKFIAAFSALSVIWHILSVEYNKHVFRKNKI